jgi:glycosyltransferase involved in cell wall biosynthesis
VPPRFVVTVHTPEMLLNFDYVLVGLFELERQGVVTLAVKLDFGMPERGYNTTRCIVEEPTTGKKKVVLFDSRDHPGSFLPRHWEGVDCYFKRSFDRSVLEREVPAEHRAKLHPMGLYLSVRSRHEHGMWRFYAGELGYILRNRRYRGLKRAQRDLVEPMLDRLRKIRDRKRIPYLDQVVVPEREGASEPVVLYQTRVFPPEPMEHPEFLASKVVVNEQRASLVRRLRRELGARLVGGLAADDYARWFFPDAITERSSARADYIALMQRSLVVVYSEGLVGSAGWKLAEYLAAGRAIVMQRSRCELPEPLVDQRDVLMFDTPDECVAACKALLDDPARARALGAAARRYHRQWVDPAANVARMLDVALHQ